MRCESAQRQPCPMMLGRFSTCVMWKIGGFGGATPGIQRPPIDLFDACPRNGHDLDILTGPPQPVKSFDRKGLAPQSRTTSGNLRGSSTACAPQYHRPLYRDDGG